MESVFAYFDGEKLVAEKKMSLLKGQKVILTVMDDSYSSANEATIMYDTAVRSESFDFLFAEGEHEYSRDDLKEKIK